MIKIYFVWSFVWFHVNFSGGPSAKESACQFRRHRDAGRIPGSVRSPGGGHVNPFQYSCLENSIDRGVWQAAVHGVAKSWTWLECTHTHTHTHTHSKQRLSIFTRKWVNTHIRTRICLFFFKTFCKTGTRLYVSICGLPFFMEEFFFGEILISVYLDLPPVL